MYGGLLCFSYLILFGISTLNFNHPLGFTKSTASVTTWSQPLSVPPLDRTDGRNAAESIEIPRHINRTILHALGSFAVPFANGDGQWTDRHTYHAHFVRPGTEYSIDVHPDQGNATITRTRTGVWALIRDLHGSYAVYPDSLLASSWKGYTELCACMLIFAGISGVYLWAGRRRERRIGLALLAAAGVVSVSLMLLVTFHG